MKKIVALLLIFTMLISCSAYASFSPISTQLQLENDDSGLLRALGIVNDADDFLNAEYITRAQFAVLTARLVDAEKHLFAGESAFSDVPAEHFAFNQINNLESLGIINGTTNTAFNPDMPITRTEALKMVLSALGYGELMELKGGWTVGVLAVAQSEKIKVNSLEINEDGTLMPNGAIDLIMQALETPVLSAVGFGESVTLTTGADALETYFDTVKIEGIIEANERYSIVGGYECAEMEIVVAGKKVKTKDRLPWDYTGLNAECYIQTDSNGMETVIYIEPKENKILTIEASEIAAFDGTGYIYGDNEKKASLSEEIDVVYNYSLMTKYDEGKFMPSDGYVTLIDNDGRGGYDVVYLFEYVNYIVGQVSTEGKYTYIYDGTGANTKPAVIISDSEGANTQLFSQDGKKISSSTAIRANECLSVFGNVTEKGLEAAVIIQSKNTLTGELSKRNISNSNTVVLTVNGTEYYVSSGFAEKAKLLGMQDGITFVLDYNGKIAGVAAGSKELPMAIGYLIAANISREGFSDKVLFKILTEFNKVIVYEGVKEIRVGNQKLGPDAVMEALADSQGNVQQIFLYTVNEAGQINELVLSSAYDVNGTDDVALYRLTDQPVTQIYYPTLVSGISSFNGMMNIDSSTRIYHIPYNKETAEDEDYKIISKDSLIVPLEYSVSAYVTSTDSVIADIIVVSRDENVWSSSAKFGVVTEVSTILDENSETKKSVTVIEKSGVVQYTATENFVVEQATMADAGYTNSSAPPPDSFETKSVSVGDVITFKTDIDGNVNFIKIVYKADEDIWTKSGDISTAVYRTGCEYYPANAYKVDSDQNVVFVPVDYITQNGSVDFAKSITYNLGRFTIVTVDGDNARNPVTMSTANDVLTYANAGVNCSKLLVLTGEQLEDMLIIIK